jgi:GT2 family glycosyltransferase
MSSPAEARIFRGQAVPSDPRVSVCILVTECAELVLECLDALGRPRSRGESMEVVVVGNGTPVDQLGYLKSRDDIVLVVNESNLGFASGCNQAASLARAPLLVFLNDDSLVEEGCIDALVRAAGSHPSIGAVGSRIISVDGTLQEAGSVIWRDGWTSHVGEGRARDSREFLEPRWADYASANGLLVVRSAWDEVGGFDERYFPAYFEDVDLSLSLSCRGYRTRYEPTAVLVHRGSQSTSPVFKEFLLTRNRLRLVEKWGDVLEQFETAPARESGPVFEAAVDRAVRSAGDRPPAPGSAACEPSTHQSSHDQFDPEQAADELQTEYVAYLEERVAAADRRIGTLESYLTKLWGVRLRRWVAGHISRHQNGSMPTVAAGRDAANPTSSAPTRPDQT